MKWKRIAAALLFPPKIVLFLLLPVGTVLLISAMLLLSETDPVRIGAYVVAFYTLCIWCVRIPGMIRVFRKFKRENRYVRSWLDDPRLRMNVTLSGNVLWNGAYAALQMGLGIYHRSVWFYTLAAYYASLAMMRFFLVWHTLHHKPGEKLREELVRYRACGWVFLFMNMTISVMMADMIRQNRVMHHHEITTIAMAAYTFTTLTVAIFNVFRYRKYNSPAMSASKAISLASACVSMLTLENTMLTTFATAEMTMQIQRLFLGVSGGVISAFIIVMAVYMIVQSNRRIKQMEIA